MKADSYSFDQVRGETFLTDDWKKELIPVMIKRKKQCVWVRFRNRANGKTELVDEMYTLSLDKVTNECGCRFENDHSNSIILCDECSKLPCHNIPKGNR